MTNATFAAALAYVWIAGCHHSGTSLVHEILGDREGVARLDLSRRQGEGAPAQAVFRTYDARMLCSATIRAGGRDVPVREGVARYFCARHLLAAEYKKKTDAEQRRAIEASWAPYWSAGAVRVEKDPDFGSAFFKRNLFGGYVLLVMRHPFSTTLGYRKWCDGAAACGTAWLEMWTLALRALQKTPSGAIVRYEAGPEKGDFNVPSNSRV